MPKKLKERTFKFIFANPTKEEEEEFNKKVTLKWIEILSRDNH